MENGNSNGLSFRYKSFGLNIHFNNTNTRIKNIYKSAIDTKINLGEINVF